MNTCVSLEDLSKEIGSSVKKPLPFVEPGFYEEIVREIGQVNATTISSEHGWIFYPGVCNCGKISGHEDAPSPCKGMIPCKYCCRVNVFVFFGLIMVSVVDTCFRLACRIFRTIQNQLYKMIQSHLVAYHIATDTLQMVLRCVCTCVITFIFVDIYVITGFLEFILKPIPSGMCNQVHNLVFKCVSKSMPQD